MTRERGNIEESIHVLGSNGNRHPNVGNTSVHENELISEAEFRLRESGVGGRVTTAVVCVCAFVCSYLKKKSKIRSSPNKAEEILDRK